MSTKYSYNELYRMFYFSINISEVSNIQKSINKCTEVQRTNLQEIRDKKLNQEYKALTVLNRESGNNSAKRGCEELINILSGFKFDITASKCDELLYPNDRPGEIIITEL